MWIFEHMFFESISIWLDTCTHFLDLNSLMRFRINLFLCSIDLLHLLGEIFEQWRPDGVTLLSFLSQRVCRQVVENQCLLSTLQSWGRRRSCWVHRLKRLLAAKTACYMDSQVCCLVYPGLVVLGKSMIYSLYERITQSYSINTNILWNCLCNVLNNK